MLSQLRERSLDSLYVSCDVNIHGIITTTTFTLTAVFQLNLDMSDLPLCSFSIHLRTKALYDIAQMKTSFSCHTQKHMTRCIQPTVLYTKVDAQCDILAMITGHNKLTTLATADMLRQNFSNSNVSENVPEGSILILEISELREVPSNTM